MKMHCRLCNTIIDASPQTRRRVSRYEDCVFRCPNESCAAAYSNAKSEANRRLIYPRPELNVPAEVRDRLSETLASSLNLVNRSSKRAKFAFETSEDAVTWTCFRYLQKTNQLNAVSGQDISSPQLLLWGAPCSTLDRNHECLLLIDELKDVLEGVGERKDRLTEPDVILFDSRSIIIIEAKHRSRNDLKRHYKNFDRYLKVGSRFFKKSPDDVAATGYYELTRNWVAGNLLAERRKVRFTLINLAPGSCRRSAADFAEMLKEQTDTAFSFLSWKELLLRLSTPMDDWFGNYVKSRFQFS